MNLITKIKNWFRGKTEAQQKMDVRKEVQAEAMRRVASRRAQACAVAEVNRLLAQVNEAVEKVRKERK